MKKASLIFSLLLVLALLMSACATPGEEETGELEGTNIPTLPGEATEEDGTGGVGGVGAATSTPLATEEATAIPMETALATEEITGTAVTTTTNLVDISRLSNLLNMNILGQDGEEIADVENVVLDLCEAQAPYLIAGVGGFLEIGERTVAIPWDSLTFSTADADGDGVADPSVILNATQEQLENVPDFDVGELDFTIPDWDAELRNFWESQIEGTGTTTDTTGVQATQPVTGTTGAEGAAVERCVVMADDILDDLDVEIAGKGAVEAGTPGVDVTAAAGTPAAVTPGASETGIPMGGLEPGADLYEEVGDVEDVILNPETGEIRYLVIEVDILDLDGNWVLVPPQAFSLRDTTLDDDDTSPDTLVLNISQEDLANAPIFEPDALPDTSVDGWDAELETYWSGVNMEVETEPTP